MKTKYQDPGELHQAVFNTNGYMHEDEPNDGFNFWRGLAIGLGFVLVVAFVATLGLILSVV